ncbi:MAG: ROK family glucokinase [Lachnospiraceae bacterium]
MKKYAVGIDVGGTTVKLGVFTVEGQLLDKWEIVTRKEENGKYILSDIATAVLGKLKEMNIEKDEVAGAGIGIPGPVRADGTVNGCVNLGWGVVPVKVEMEALLGVPVEAGNDANVAALGESWQGGGKGYGNAVMVTLGTGVGGGVVIDGGVISGFHGYGGEIGHMMMNPNETEFCNCGKRGCLEQYASATGVVRVAKKYLAQKITQSPLRDCENLTAKDVFDAAKENDTLALEIVEDVCSTLALALSYISCTVDPEVFIIGGGVSKAGSILTDTIAKYFVNDVFGDQKKTVFALASLGNDAGIYGSAKLVLA